MNPYPTSDDILIKRLEQMYLYLHRQYRLGNFEKPIGYACRWHQGSDEFHELCDEQESAKAGTIHFTAAIQDLHRLTLHIDEGRNELAEANAVLMLRCRCLIYEATDYLLEVPDDLAKYFTEYAERFVCQAWAAEQAAEKLNRKPKPFLTKDDRTNVMKLQLIAALCGANEIYRRHDGASYDTSHRILEDINRFVSTELPLQHERRRESFGLQGLSNYLIGRVLSRKGRFGESLIAFRRSAEAYLSRLRQKEEFYQRGRISLERYEEKVSVTVRRAALVAAFGDGYHYFVNGQLSRAMESLTLARAALTGNSGDVYLSYVDMLYWACKRAANSSDIDVINQCVAELTKCRTRFRELIPHSHYFHRAGIQLALALFFRAKLRNSDSRNDFELGLQYLDEAIAYAQGRNIRRHRNTHLLATALALKSRYLSSRYEKSKKPRKSVVDHRYLEEARIVACQAEQASEGMKMLRGEVLATLADVYIDLAEVHIRYHKDDFQYYFDSALHALKDALEHNGGENMRNDAVCFLRLTKLYLLNPTTLSSAHDSFERWLRISNRVEHDYCQTLAQQLEKELHTPVLMIDPWKNTKYAYWNDKLFDFLLDEALKKFANKHRQHKLKPKQLRSKLGIHLRLELGYGNTKVGKLIRDHDLEARVTRLLAVRETEIGDRRLRSSQADTHVFTPSGSFAPPES
jgi:hypothetical protein